MVENMREAYFAGDFDKALTLAQLVLEMPWRHSTETLIFANSVVTSVFGYRALADN